MIAGLVLLQAALSIGVAGPATNLEYLPLRVAAAEGYFPDASAVFHLVGDKTLSNFVRGLPVADQVGVRGTVMGGLSEEEFANGADVNERTGGGQTPLILATIFGHTHLIPLLLEAGADPPRDDASATHGAARGRDGGRGNVNRHDAVPVPVGPGTQVACAAPRSGPRSRGPSHRGHIGS